MMIHPIHYLCWFVSFKIHHVVVVRTDAALALNFDSNYFITSFNDGSCLYPDCNMDIAYGTSVLEWSSTCYRCCIIT